MNLVDLLAEHAWCPATSRRLCGFDVVWGDHPAHQAMKVHCDLTGRLKAFARDCVYHGDMTPGAERLLLTMNSDRDSRE